MIHFFPGKFTGTDVATAEYVLTWGQRLQEAVMLRAQALLDVLKHLLFLVFVFEQCSERKTPQNHCIGDDTPEKQLVSTGIILKFVLY